MLLSFPNTKGSGEPHGWPPSLIIYATPRHIKEVIKEANGELAQLAISKPNHYGYYFLFHGPAQATAPPLSWSKPSRNASRLRQMACGQGLATLLFTPPCKVH